MGKNEVYLPAREITRRYSISETTVWRRAKRGDLHPVRHGRMVRYPSQKSRHCGGKAPTKRRGTARSDRLPFRFPGGEISVQV